MCLTKSEVISDKVGVVQTTFDVGDFKHPDRDSYKSKKDDSNQMKLIIGCEKVYDKKTDCDDIMNIIILSLIVLIADLQMLQNMIQI